MSSDDFWEDFYSKQVNDLEKQRDKLSREIEQLHQLKKPDMNRMVAEKLDTTTSGCNCQQMALILVQDGKVKAHYSMSPTPKFLCEVKTKSDYYRSGEVLDQQGEAYYKKRSKYYSNYDDQFDWVKRHPNLVETIQINGKRYYQEHCHYADDSLSEGLDDYSCPEEIKKLPNGIYHILFEQACFSYITCDGEEGDGESDVRIYNSVPLYEFLSNKDWMLKEVDPEAEELASSYLYIQETKQGRRMSEAQEKSSYHDWDYSVLNQHSHVAEMPSSIDRGFLQGENIPSLINVDQIAFTGPEPIPQQTFNRMGRSGVIVSSAGINIPEILDLINTEPGFIQIGEVLLDEVSPEHTPAFPEFAPITEDEENDYETD